MPHGLSPALRAVATVSGLAAIALALAGAGCKGDAASPVPTGEVAAAERALSSEEQALIERRDALLNSRRALREKRAALVEERRRLVESGGDTSELDRKVDELTQEETRLGNAEDAFDRDLEELFAQQRVFLTQLSSGNDDTSRMAAREAALASREKSLASRERSVADREATLAERERKLAVRERDTCGQGPARIIQAPAAPGTRYTRRDVDPLLKRARRVMSSRGILPSDLPPAARGLEAEATKAMESGDYGRARFAATQLVASVEGVQIDKGFIQAKIARLNDKIKKGQRLDGSTQKDLDTLFRKATADYGDGKFERANRQLNTIDSLLDRKG